MSSEPTFEEMLRVGADAIRAEVAYLESQRRPIEYLLDGPGQPHLVFRGHRITEAWAQYGRIYCETSTGALLFLSTEDWEAVTRQACEARGSHTMAFTYEAGSRVPVVIDCSLCGADLDNKAAQ